MIKLDQLYGLATLGETLQRLTTKMQTRGVTLGEVSQECFAVRGALLHILSDALLPLDSCKKSAARLLKALDDMIHGPNLKANWANTLNPYFSDPIRQELLAFEQDLATELNSLPVYFATKKRSYSTDSLLNNAEEAFSPNVIACLGEFVVENIREAGRCLLLDRFTATGFHVARAVEDVARRYYWLVTTRDPTDATLGKIAGELDGYFQKNRKSLPSTGMLGLVIGPLDQICKIYRNPLTHPDIITLDEEQAIDAFEHAISAIATMIRDVQSGGVHFSVKRVI